MTLKCDLLILMMTADAVENDTVECPILNNPYSDPKLVSPAILQVILTQKRAKISKIRKFDFEV